MQAHTTPACPRAGGNVMVESQPDLLRAENGVTARREYGLTPNGNPISGRWVLRDAGGRWIDFDQYQHDLFERNGLQPNY